MLNSMPVMLNSMLSSAILRYDWHTFTDDAAANGGWIALAHRAHLDGVSDDGSDILHPVILCEHLRKRRIGWCRNSHISKILLIAELWTNISTAVSDVAELVDGEHPHFAVQSV